MRVDSQDLSSSAWSFAAAVVVVVAERLVLLLLPLLFALLHGAVVFVFVSDTMKIISLSRVICSKLA